MGNIISFAEMYKRKGGICMGLERQRQKEIEVKVSELLRGKKLDGNQYVDIVACVKSDGFLVQSADLGSKVTGYLAVNDNEPVEKGYNRLIVVNEKFDNPDREDEVILKKSRFIIAHEYGHYILHKPEDQPIYARRDTIHTKELKEQEADYFARSILMPAKPFLKITEIMEDLREETGMSDEKFRELSLHVLGTHFKVTRNKVRKRLGDIELLKSIAN